MSRRVLTRRAILVLLGGSVAGCGATLNKPYPEKRQYVLTADRGAKEPAPRNGLVLLIRRFTIDPAYQDRGIVTRTDAITARSDFYNEFFIEPAQLINSQVTSWLAASGLFSEIVGPTSGLTPTHVLEGYVAKLYGDLSQAPTAVIELQLLLFDVRGGGNRVLLHPDLERDLPAGNGEPSALVQAWNTGFADMLAEFERSLRQSLVAAAR